MIPFSEIFLIVGSLLVIFMLLSLIRAVLGPTIPDRVVALDTINTLVVASMVALGAGYKEVIYIDVAIVYAILSFIATLYIAKYLEGGI
ncbi:MAG: cation:proton antiporter [Euryarchaeota archaeon CG01_land_8_20_14_3_00_38_12]|nr:MAG: cation:proton antiporter [Euryarchaeota archaeon CG01_land_8_20_14_3_00_38_12]PJB21180.1 MAG: cation:proton antiporter [Euryarchaeota archaeon CG_4_9_14_3_um_filter_38_12]